MSTYDVDLVMGDDADSGGTSGDFLFISGVYRTVSNRWS